MTDEKQQILESLRSNEQLQRLASYPEFAEFERVISEAKSELNTVQNFPSDVDSDTEVRVRRYVIAYLDAMLQAFRGLEEEEEKLQQAKESLERNDDYT